MPVMNVDKLPPGLVSNMRSAAGTKSEQSDVLLLDISSSPDAQRMFSEFLCDEEGGSEPLVTPSFGTPLAPFVTPAAQADVLNLLSTFAPLMAAAFAAGAAPSQFIVATAPLPFGGVHFHQSKIALQAALGEIQTSERFAAACPALAAVPSGAVICDLVCTYGNCVISTRLHKH